MPLLVLLFLFLQVAKFLPRSFFLLNQNDKTCLTMDSTGSSKRRKIGCVVEEEEEEEDEEIKMEKFFALIRSIRESHERLIRFGSDAYVGDTQNGSAKLRNRAMGVWKPQFQIEDFMEVDPLQNRSQKHTPLNSSLADASPDQKKAADDEREAEKGMNLSLSL